MDLGKKIRKIRLDKEIKQESLALALGVDQSYISRIENDEVRLDLERIGKIAEALEVTVFDLIPEMFKTEFHNCTNSGNFNNYTIKHELSDDLVTILKELITKIEKLK